MAQVFLAVASSRIWWQFLLKKHFSKWQLYVLNNNLLLTLVPPAKHPPPPRPLLSSPALQWRRHPKLLARHQTTVFSRNPVLSFFWWEFNSDVEPFASLFPSLSSSPFPPDPAGLAHSTDSHVLLWGCNDRSSSEAGSFPVSSASLPFLWSEVLAPLPSMNLQELSRVGAQQGRWWGSPWVLHSAWVLAMFSFWGSGWYTEVLVYYLVSSRYSGVCVMKRLHSTMYHMEIFKK